MGIDIGTQGVRTVVSDEKGMIAAGSSVSFSSLNISGTPGFYEQDPAMWWDAASEAIVKTVAGMKAKGYDPSDIVAVSVDGTSGTILPIDENNRPLYAGIMYNDMRSKDETETVRKYGSAHESKLGLRFNASFSLPKILWLKNNKPDIYEHSKLIIHQADYITGKLCGEYGYSDYSNSLKTGYDLVDDKWPGFMDMLGLDRIKLPAITAPGEVIGRVSREASESLGLSTKTFVTAGATDGYSSALAAGAVHIGDWATILGTTMVLKGVSGKIIPDPTGSSYCHKLPTGNWMVGGASNTGGNCLNAHFDRSELSHYDASVDQLTPTGVLIYPLTGTGERYPFVDPEAKQFIIGDVTDKRVLFSALMEGVGYAERLAYDHNKAMGCTIGTEIYSSGGACRSDEWLRIRASILNRSIKVPVVVDASMGSAMLAASKTYFSNLEEAASSMITFSKTIEPVACKVRKYDELYHAFREQCKKRFRIGEYV